MEDGRYKVLLVIVDPDSNEVLLRNTTDAVTLDFAGGLSAIGEEWLDTAKRLLKEQFDVEGDAVGVSFVRREAILLVGTLTSFYVSGTTASTM